MGRTSVMMGKASLPAWVPWSMPRAAGGEGRGRCGRQGHCSCLEGGAGVDRLLEKAAGPGASEVWSRTEWGRPRRDLAGGAGPRAGGCERHSRGGTWKEAAREVQGAAHTDRGRWVHPLTSGQCRGVKGPRTGQRLSGLCVTWWFQACGHRSFLTQKYFERIHLDIV